MPQQGFDVLLDVMISGAFPESFGTSLVMAERTADDFPQGFWIEFHE